MDGKSNISGLNKQVSSFDTMPDVPSAKAKKACATSATTQAVAGPSSANKVSKPSSSIFAEASKKLCQPSSKPGWSAKNPVVVMSNRKEFALLANKMLSQFEESNPNDKTLKEIRNIKLYSPLITPSTLVHFLSRDFNLPLTALDASKILEPLAAANHRDSKNEEGLVYNIDGNPVGLAWCVILKNNDPQKEDEYYIIRLVADPWTRGAGTTIIEAAVNRSEELGFRGKIVLKPANDEVKAQYERLGFVCSGKGDELELNPTISDKWSRGDNGQYYYSSNATDEKLSNDVEPRYFTSLNALKI